MRKQMLQVLFLALIALPACFAQPAVTLGLGSASAVPGGTVSLPISISSSGGALPTAVQWSFTLPGGVTLLSVAAGSSATASGKSLSCSGNNCVVFGLNTTPIPNGTLASANFQVAANAAGTLVVSLGGVVASDTNSIPASGGSGTISLPAPPPVPALSALSCGGGTIQTPGSLSCSVTLTSAALSGGFAVTLADNHASLTVPANVTVPSGASNTSFTVTAAQVAADAAATVTASASGVSRTANLSLIAPASLASLTCAPASLNSGQTTSCTVALTKAAASTAVVSLSSNAAGLPVPSSVNIGAGSGSVSFNAVAGTIATNQTATVTASFGGVSRTASVNLVAPAPAVLSSLSCSPSTFSTAGSSVCTVTLTAAAASNAVVGIADDSANVTVPASVTVQAGQGSVQFSASVLSVPADQAVTITASLNGATRNASLTLTAPATLSSLTCAPGTLTSGQAATCTAALSKAASSVMTVSLSGGGAPITVPGSVSIPGGASSASFNVNAAAIASSQTATVAATLNGVTRTASINLTAPAGLSGLNCFPTNFSSAGSSSCTVSISAPAATNTTIAISDPSANVTTPATVTVLAGQTSTGFSAVVVAVPSDETVTITAALGGGSQSAALVLTAPAVLSSLSCSPSSLSSNQSAICTVSLNKTAAGVNITISDDNATLASPSSVAVPAGASSATFSVTAASVGVNQAVTVSAVLYGITRTAAISLTVPEAPSAPGISGLSCLPASVPAGGSSLCTVTVSPAAVSALSFGVAVNSDALALPASVTIPETGTSAQFRINVPASASPQSVILSVSLTGVTKTLMLTITTPDTASGPPQMTSLGCSPSILAPGESSECTLYMREEAGTDLFPSISASSANLVIPASLTVRTGTKSQAFQVSASEFLSSAQQVDLTITLNGQTVSTRFALNLGTALPVLTLLDCAPAALTPGAAASCEVKLKSAAPFAAELSVASSHSVLQVPTRVAVAAGAVTASFGIQAAFTDVPQNATVSAGWSGNTPLTKVVEVTPHSIKVEAPAAVFTRALSRVDFSVNAAHSAGLSTTISAAGLPSGAVLQGSRFSWTPNVSDVGEYPVAFRATDAAGLSAAKTTRVVVRAEKPTIQGLFNPAGYTPTDSCSPNAMVTFLGSGFSLHDPMEATGTPVPTELAGVRIRINGVYAPITFVSDTTIHFQCPVLEPGVRLEIVMEYEDVPSLPANAAGAEAIVSVAPVVVRMSDATPGIYQIKGTQAAALIAGTGMIAGLEGGPARPVHVGEFLEIYSNGMGAVSEPMAQGRPAPLDRLVHTLARVTVIFPGGQRVPAEFAGLTPGSVGLFQVNIRVPDGITAGDAVPMYVELLNPDGSTVRSNTATVAVR